MPKIYCRQSSISHRIQMRKMLDPIFCVARCMQWILFVLATNNIHCKAYHEFCTQAPLRSSISGTCHHLLCTPQLQFSMTLKTTHCANGTISALATSKNVHAPSWHTYGMLIHFTRMGDLFRMVPCGLTPSLPQHPRFAAPTANAQLDPCWDFLPHAAATNRTRHRISPSIRRVLACT